MTKDDLQVAQLGNRSFCNISGLSGLAQGLEFYWGGFATNQAASFSLDKYDKYNQDQFWRQTSANCAGNLDAF